MKRLRSIVTRNLVPLVFLAVSAIGIVWGEISLNRITSDILERWFRNVFIVLSLIVPIVAGLGLNFGIVLGAMAGQMGLMVVQNGRITGLGGIAVAVVCSIPIAMLLGWLTGLLFNRTRGREMITGIILGFFANGIYQFLFLILAGPVIPLRGADVLLPQGMGMRVTINLTSVERALDAPLDHVAPDAPLRRAVESVFGENFQGAIPLRFGGDYWGELPLPTLAVVIALCLALAWFFRTKLGQDLRAVGQDSHVAEVAGIAVDRVRIIAIVLSMVLAAIGQIIFLHNMAVMNTFQSHEQVGFYAIAALLVGGATVTRVNIWNALVGTFLFHTLIVVVSLAGQKIMDSPQIGEYLREFFAYTIIGMTLAIHAWRRSGR